jgi:hypothetical protein
LGRFSFLKKSASKFGVTSGSELRRSGCAGTILVANCGAVRYGVLIAILAVGVLAPSAGAQNLSYKIPPVKIPFKVKEQTIAITASAVITLVSMEKDEAVLKLELTADLADLQHNMTGLLSAQLDKDDHCGDRITIEHATLVPAEPASVATVQLHYERWACVKVFGKQQTKKLVSGEALIPIKLTPGVEQDNTELRLVPEVGRIQADGSLGELLRSGAVGEMIREKIRTAILSAMEKGTNLSATLPPAAQGHVTIENAEFKEAGAGRLLVVLAGKIRISKEQMQMLSRQVKERVAAK